MSLLFAARLPSALAQARRSLRSLSSLASTPPPTASFSRSPPRAPVPELAFSPPSDAPLPRMAVVLRSSVGSRAAQWARRNGCPWDASTLRAARRSLHPPIVQWVEENQ